VVGKEKGNQKVAPWCQMTRVVVLIHKKNTRYERGLLFLIVKYNPFNQNPSQTNILHPKLAMNQQLHSDERTRHYCLGSGFC